MEATAKHMKEILKTVAIHQAADSAQAGMEHASRVARFQVNSWQADIIRHSPEVKQANNAAELRALMSKSEGAVVFLPQQAAVTAEIIDGICRESPFDKLIIWENA